MSDPISPQSTPQRSWSILQCPECGGKFKAPAEAKDAEVACPHCGESVAVLIPAPDEEATSAVAPLPSTAPIASPTPADHASQSRRRRKTVQGEQPDWEKAPGEQSRASAMDNDMTEYLTGDPNDPSSLRIKRVRRKKNPTGTQKLGRVVIIGTISVVVLATVIAIVLLVKTQVEVVAEGAEAQRQLPGKVAELVAQALEAKNDSAILTKTEEEACLSIINGFYSAKTIEEKLNFVRLPERVKPMLEKVYATKSNPEDFKIGEIVLSQKLVDKGRRFITIAATVTGSDRESQLFAFEQQKDTILMDWEVSSGHQLVPIQEFISKRISEPTVFRAKLTRSEYYAGHFEDKARYQSVSLTYPGQDEFKLAGYIDRSKPWADVLFARLEFEAPSLIVTIQYPPNSSSAFEVEITGVVLDSWFY